jgi:putative glutamine amidotransferase
VDASARAAADAAASPAASADAPPARAPVSPDAPAGAGALPPALALAAAPRTPPPPPRRSAGPPLRIGLSARILHPDSAQALGFRDKTLQYLEASVAHWIMAHGAIVFMVPTLESRSSVQRAAVSLRDYVDALDGLVLQGGSDVSPTTYGEQPQQPQWSGDRTRDLYEIELIWAFVFQQKPVLGICRGMQLLNVAFNGSLVQDIPTELPQALPHVDLTQYERLHHDIALEPGSRLASLYGDVPRRQVNSIHHQCVKRLGNGLVVEARCPHDGVIEAVRWTGSSFVMGVQWHPEFHADSAARLEPDQTPLLDSGPIVVDFLDQCRARAGRASLAAVAKAAR